MEVKLGWGSLSSPVSLQVSLLTQFLTSAPRHSQLAPASWSLLAAKLEVRIRVIERLSGL